MARPTKWLLAIVAVGGAYALRARLVHLLTRTTGTWVGSPND